MFPPSLGVTQPQGKEQKDSSAGSAQGSDGSLTGAGTSGGTPPVFCQDGQIMRWVLAGITTSSGQQEFGWAGQYVAESARD